MPTQQAEFEEDDDGDDLAPDDSGEWSGGSFDEDDEPDVIPCPYCGREISEDAEQCPKCRNYVSREDRPAERKPMWVVVTVIVLLGAMTGVWYWLLR
jgi:predicted nucleic acid-binding Zn ribbon protein